MNMENKIEAPLEAGAIEISAEVIQQKHRVIGIRND